MADDEPLDDLRAVAMAGGTAAARIVETLAREAREVRQRDQDRQAALQAQQAQVLVARHTASGLPSWQPGLAARQEQAAERDRRGAQPTQEQGLAGPAGPADHDRREAATAPAEAQRDDHAEQTESGRNQGPREQHQATTAGAGASPAVGRAYAQLNPKDREAADALIADMQKRYGTDLQPSGEARDARRVADGMNGADPARAAQQPGKGRATGRSPGSPAPVTRTADRGR